MGDCRVSTWPILDEDSSFILKLPVQRPVPIPHEYRTVIFSYKSAEGIQYARCNLSEVKENLLHQGTYDCVMDCDNPNFCLVVCFSKSRMGPLIRSINLEAKTSEDAQYYVPESYDLGSEADQYLDDQYSETEDEDTMG